MTGRPAACGKIIVRAAITYTEAAASTFICTGECTFLALMEVMDKNKFPPDARKAWLLCA
jgi:hypothetical protein